MTRNFFILSLYLGLLTSCATSIRNNVPNKNDYNGVIMSSIADFTKSGKLYKRDSIFHIDIYTSYTRVHIEENENGTAQVVRDDIDDNIIVVNIIANYNKFLDIDSTTVFPEEQRIPTHYLEERGKLFLWRNFSKPVNPKTYSVLNKHDLLLPNNLDGLIERAEYGEPIASEATHYFFCKKDLSTYKRVKSKVPLGYYDPPSGLRCD